MSADPEKKGGRAASPPPADGPEGHSARRKRRGEDHAEDPQLLTTLTRGLSILDVLAASQSTKGLSQATLARQLGFRRSTIYRYLASLQKAGLIEATEGGRYRLGPRIVVLAAASLQERFFPRYAERFVDQLARSTGETAHATLFDQGYAVTIELANGAGPIGPRISVGTRRPAHCSASGKTFLAFSPPEIFDEYVRKPLGGPTKASITDVEELRQEVAWVAQHGYATDRSEFVAGISCVAAPVFDSHRRVAGALSVSVAAHDLTDDVRVALARPLLRSTRAFSQTLGYPGPQ